MVEVVVTGDFVDWYDALDAQDVAAVVRVVTLLEGQGIALGFPYSSAIEGSKIALRELRAQSQGHPIRILYAFDPIRRAVLLLGGDKTGDARWYETNVPRAERIWREYLEEMTKP